jgi:hypothetical protein
MVRLPKQQQLDPEIPFAQQFTGKFVRGVIAIVITNPSVVPANNEMRAASIPPHERVKNGFPRAGITHRRAQPGEINARARQEIAQEHLISGFDGAVAEIPWLFPPDQRVDEKPVAPLEPHSEKIFMSTMHWVAGLKTGHSFPSSLPKLAPGSRWVQP